MKTKGLCEICGSPIPEERLEFLPETTTCVKCSQTAMYSKDQILGIGLGSAADIERMNPEDYEVDDNAY